MISTAKGNSAKHSWAAQLGSTECSTRPSAVKHSNKHGKHSAWNRAKARDDTGDGYREASNELDRTATNTYTYMAYICVFSKGEKQMLQGSSEARTTQRTVRRTAKIGAAKHSEAVQSAAHSTTQQ